MEETIFDHVMAGAGIRSESGTPKSGCVNYPTPDFIIARYFVVFSTV